MGALGLLSRVSNLAVRLFYKLEVTGEPVPGKGAVLLLANHPNALIDAACVFAAAGRPVRFLAKSPLFRMPVVGWLIRSSGAIPVYRRQDDPGQVRKNVQGLQEAHRALGLGWAVGIFPEGRSHGEPAMSPMRTGAARIALGAVEEVGQCFPIVPLGLSFSAKDRFRSEALVVVGEPIEWSDLKTEGDRGSTNRESVRQLTGRIGEGLGRVTLNLEQWEDGPLVACAEAVHRAEMASESHADDPGDRLERSRLVAEGLGELRRNDPERLETLLPAVARFHRVLSLLGLEARDLDQSPGPISILGRSLVAVVFLSLSLPVLVCGSLLFAVPYVATDQLSRWHRWAQEERSTVKLLGGFVFYSVWLALLAFSISGLFDVVAGLLSIPVLWGLAWGTQRLRDLWGDVYRELRLALVLGSRKSLRQQLLDRRKLLAKEIEGARLSLLTREGESTRIP